MTAEAFASKDWNVVATMRNPEKETDLKTLPNVSVLHLDVQKAETIEAAVSEVIAKFGSIDVLINNAGYGSLGFFEGTPIDEIQRQYDVNVFGVMRVTQVVLPHMRKAKGGTIVNVSSVAGGHTNALGSVYYSSKWALEAWTECLSYELLPLGIQLKLVQPGGFKTDFGSRSLVFSAPPPDVPEYQPMMEKVQKSMVDALLDLPDPNPVVPDAIYLAATEGDPAKLRYPVYVDGDPYGTLYALRKEKGPDAQYQAVLAAQQE
ncbi:hypothetical protein CTAYLR_009648 [Chrysophaeum taylorii]|uniref:Short-chain dehydrogenase/reductase n=1 Tax=Chrysophaeum taylorii TaxID=2483200 RepID=A0AAD7XJZ0_9STRA|nr:hypothetical protein CTAYLR_009648 [Chrysophaeum taylorii]